MAEVYFSKEELREISGMIKKHFELAEASPNNELLKYYEYREPDDFHEVKVFWDEFCKRFGKGFVPIKRIDKEAIRHNKEGVMSLFRNYDNALEAELKRIDKGILDEWGLEK